MYMSICGNVCVYVHVHVQCTIIEYHIKISSSKYNVIYSGGIKEILRRLITFKFNCNLLPVC